MFPKDNIPARQKDKDWHLQWGRSLLAWHQNNWNKENFPYAKLLELNSYAHGNQPIRQYKPNSNFLRNNNLFNGLGANHRNLKVAYTILNAVHGKISDIQIEPRVQQIDAKADDIRLTYEAKIKRLMELNQFKMDISAQLAELKINPIDFPMDDEEAEIFLRNKPVIVEEAEMESAIGGVFEQNNLDSVRSVIRWDLLNLGVAGIKTETVNGIQIIRSVDPLNCGTNICKFPDFRDLRFAYEIRPVAPEVIRSVCGEYFTQEEYKRIQGAAGSLINSPNLYRTFNQPGAQIPGGDLYNLIVDFEVISTNNMTFEIKASETLGVKSTLIMGERNPTAERNDRAFYKMQPRTVYKGKYIVGADLIYDWGPKEIDVRPPYPENPDDVVFSNPANAELGYSFFCPSLSHGTFVSTLEVMLPMIDNLQQTQGKITELLSRIYTQAVSIDLDAIVQLSLGKDKKLEPIDVIDIFVQYGIDLYSSSVYKGMPNSSANRGIQFKDNKSGDMLGVLLNAFVTQYNLLQNFVGINSVVMGGTQSAEIGKAVTEMQIGGTDNVLKNVIAAEISLVKSSAKHLMWTAQRYGLTGVYNRKRFKIDPLVHSLNIYNCDMEVLPSPGEWQMLYAESRQFAAEGKIDYEDMVAVRDIKNFKTAQLYLAYKKRRKETQDRMIASQNAQETFKGQQESALVAAQAEMEQDKAKSENKIAEIKVLEYEKRKTALMTEFLKQGKIPKQLQEFVGMEIDFISLQSLEENASTGDTGSTTDATGPVGEPTGEPVPTIA